MLFSQLFWPLMHVFIVLFLLLQAMITITSLHLSKSSTVVAISSIVGLVHNTTQYPEYLFILCVECPSSFGL